MGRNFRSIKAWQCSDDLVVLVYSSTRSFPAEELYGITSQLRRAIVSIPTNIAEGANRQYKKEFLQFLYVAQGSMAEAEYLLYIAKRLAYLTDKDYARLEGTRERAAKLLCGLIDAVKKEVS